MRFPEPEYSNSMMYSKDNICNFAVMSLKDDTESAIIMSCGHILFNNKRCDIKLAQVYQIMKSLEIIAKYYGMNNIYIYNY